MTDIEDFIMQHEGNQRLVMNYFHTLLTEEFNLIAKLAYKLPFYYRKSWICYLYPTKKGNVDLSFPRGKELSNSQGLLKSRGRKMVYSINFTDLKDLPETAVREIIHEAILLDEKVPYNWQREGF